jgi:hypothetical protein
LIRERAREEYDYLNRLLNECVEKRNANSGDSPKFVIVGASVQLGHMALYIQFDQQYSNPDDYVLVLRAGLAPFRKPLFGSGPTPEESRLRATPSDDLSSILWDWIGNRTRLTSAELAEFALDRLTAYYDKHTPN